MMRIDSDEAKQHDPLLRLDQMIYRQDKLMAQMDGVVHLLQAQCVLLAILVVTQLVLLLLKA